MHFNLDCLCKSYWVKQLLISPWWSSGQRWHTQHVSSQQAALGSDACSPSPSPVKGHWLMINPQSRIAACCDSITLLPSYLSEVALFNEDRACKWNHVTSFGFVGRKVRYLHIWLRDHTARMGQLHEFKCQIINSLRASFTRTMCVFFFISNGLNIP